MLFVEFEGKFVVVHCFSIPKRLEYTELLMYMLFYLVVIPVIVYVIVRKLDARHNVSGNTQLLIAACILFGASLFIPSPQIHGQDTQFLTHLFGGGVFTGLLWLYFKPVFKHRRWYIELLHLFVIVSALGVLNELYELLAHEIHIKSEPIIDTSWDLLANTLGIILFYGCYRTIKYIQRKK